MSKQDVTSIRTPAQLEQKYSFGKKFSEIIGLIDDNRKEVDSAMSGLRDEITHTSTELSRTAEEINVQAEKVTKIEGDVATLSEEVEMKVDASAVSIAVRAELENGVDRVETTTGYTFDSDGLQISKSGEQMSNLLDNTGMYVKRSGIDILKANGDGVVATNLHANTYLIIGAGNGQSRFEDYVGGRTGCFWVGG